MISGTVKFTDSSSSLTNVTYNNSYRVIGLNGTQFVILDDNGKPFSADVSGASWEITELWALERVI